jgi:hypothetical protein
LSRAIGHEVSEVILAWDEINKLLNYKCNNAVQFEGLTHISGITLGVRWLAPNSMTKRSFRHRVPLRVRPGVR